MDDFVPHVHIYWSDVKESMLFLTNADSTREQGDEGSSTKLFAQLFPLSLLSAICVRKMRRKYILPAKSHR